MFLLKVWEQWSIYPPIFLGGLEASFQRKNNDLEDDLLALQKGVMDGSTLDVESLVRKAKYNGIYYDPEKDDPMRLFKKLAFAEEYIRIKESPPEVLENELENSSADSLLGINPAPAWQIGGGHMQPAPSSPPTHPTSSPSTSVTTKAVGQWDAVEDDEEEEVDGVAMEEEDDVDGVAMDTVAASSQSSKKRKSENTLGSSRFSDESEGEDDEDVDGVALDDDTFFNQPPTTSSSEQETPSSSHMSREVIREIEGKILKYRDELESSESGTYSTNEIDKLCSEKRQTLIQEQESSQQGHEYKKQRK
jgi:hypothetical protein